MTALHEVLESQPPSSVSPSSVGTHVSDGGGPPEDIPSWPWLPSQRHVLTAEPPVSCRCSSVAARDGARHILATSVTVQREMVVRARSLTERCGTRLRSSALLRGDVPHPSCRMWPLLLASETWRRRWRRKEVVNCTTGIVNWSSHPRDERACKQSTRKEHDTKWV